MSLLAQTAIFLAAAVVAVPISKRLGLGAVLGYLAAGAVIGPWALRLIGDVEAILHFAEFGVVLLLFIIGLELQPGRLWVMRKAVFGLGGAQVGATAVLIGIAGALFGLPLEAAVVAGLALALSSTAFALQLLAEKNQLTTRHGRTAFSILLFQDIAAIPILALVPLLGVQAGKELTAGESLIGVLKVVAMLGVTVVGGHYLLRQVFRMVARAGIHEVFTATALLTVVGMALLMDSLGLSMALGAFLAGVLLADSEFRHELEADIEPFKGLLLGLFFIAVGMSVNFGLLVAQPLLILALVVGLAALKALVLFLLGRVSGLNGAAAKLTIAISQGGEFAFVILGVALGARVMEPALAELLILVVILSMVVTPLLFVLNERAPWARRKGAAEPAYDTPAGDENQVIIAGFGRFGQIIARILRAKRIGFTALEVSPEQVDFVKKYGNKIYYGDPARLELLRAAKADQAKIFVLAIDDVESSLRTAELVVKHFPRLKIYARARNRRHVHQLMDLGVEVIQRETFLSSLDIARRVLVGLGLSDSESETAVQRFKEHDERRLFEAWGEHDDEEKMILLAKKAAEELEELFAEDVEEEAEAKIQTLG